MFVPLAILSTLASRRFWTLAVVLIALTAALVVAAVSRSYAVQVKNPLFNGGFFYAGSFLLWHYIFRQDLHHGTLSGAQ
jgi:hypothetical protein